MTTRWPTAFVLSALLHATVIAAAIWMGLSLIESSSPPRAWMNLVVPTGKRASAAVEHTATTTVRFATPQVLPRPVNSEPESPQQSKARAAAQSTEPAMAVPSQRNGPLTVPSQHTTSPSHHPSGSTTTAVKAGAIRHVDAGEIADDLRREAIHTEQSDRASITYQSLIEERLRELLEAVPGLDDGLSAEATFELLPTGCTAHIELTQNSGNERFDRAILQTISSLTLPPPPTGVLRVQRIPFRTRARR